MNSKLYRACTLLLPNHLTASFTCSNETFGFSAFPAPLPRLCALRSQRPQVPYPNARSVAPPTAQRPHAPLSTDTRFRPSPRTLTSPEMTSTLGARGDTAGGAGSE